MPVIGHLDAGIVRALIVLVPVGTAAGLWLVCNDIRRRAAAVLALIWSGVALLTVNVLAVGVGWWSFGTAGPSILGVPVDLLLGWAVLWSLVPVLASRWIDPRYTVIGLVLLDVYAMPTLGPAVRLRDDWWWGEALAVAVCLVPGVVLADLTVRRRRLRVRVCLQVVLFTAVLFVAIPLVCVELWRRSGLLAPTDWRLHVGGPVDVVVVQLAGVVAMVALAAVVEFARAGGTPWPWDPPSHLVTSGPYAYVSNPMQLCGTLLLVLTGVVTSIPLMYAAAVVAMAFSAGLAALVEDDALGGRFGADWAEYRASVRPWLPRWRPVRFGAPARLFVARGCDPCSELGSWIAARDPVGMEIVDAQTYPTRLRRLRYAAPDGVELDGVRALAAAFAHLGLGWAVAGWVIGAPGIGQVVQVFVDACGGGPR
ncbi:hypothetical protein HH308_17500 [Gordonia sp. TBRC 11910]|uniref:Phospholipid methyltransferase n=1 Tax=Gordonia asplenii TaxID=2725283 RepID=A0A848L370_9ACTN|nr:methyltransferase [Gordonia asplenii]NMO03011.1 hypothetical protein [Gordonia asplenii]